MLKRELLSLFI